jgi:hypothetical protein
MKTITKLLLLLLLAQPYIIIAGTIDPNISDSKYIEYGKKFECILKLCGVYKDGGLFCASAVAISDTCVLTAAHVVENAITAKVVDSHDKEFIIDDIIIHPEYDEMKLNGNDIAVMFTKEPLKISYYPELYEEEDEVGKVCALSGYGLTGTFNTGSVKSDDRRRAGSNIIDEIDSELLICSPSRGSNDKRTQLEFLICSGDSGGGLFIDKKIAGINSCVFATDKKPNSSYTDTSGHTRISKHKKWIKSHLVFNLK